MIQCPYCSHQVEDGQPWQEIAHMQLEHPEVIRERLERIGVMDASPRFAERYPEPRRIVDEDLQQIVTLALDLAYYRSVADDGGLGPCAWLELRDAVAQLPEGEAGRRGQKTSSQENVKPPPGAGE